MASVRSRRFKLSAALVALSVAAVGAVVAANSASAMAPMPNHILLRRVIASPQTSAAHVTYLGRTFTVPASWSVVDLSKNPTACVRFDVHALYLGTPSTEQKCPAYAVATATGAALVEPATSQAAPSAQDDAIAQRITATLSNVEITASYGADRGQVVRVLKSAGVPTPSVVASAAPNQAVLAAPSASSVAIPQAAQTKLVATAGAVTPALVAGMTDAFMGRGFDACTAPSPAQMSAWKASPFAAIGVYIGGTSRACAQPELTPSWVTTETAAGWHLLPIYAGIEVGGITNPSAQAIASANDAVAQASALGIGKGAVLCYDMEGGEYTAAQQATAEAFLSAWTQQLHNLGYRSGLYGEEVRDLGAEGVVVTDWGKMTSPDVIDVANPNGQADDDPGADPGSHWLGNRIHQFVADASTTYGGVTINIDEDWFWLSQPCGNASQPGVQDQPGVSIPCGTRPGTLPPQP